LPSRPNWGQSNNNGAFSDAQERTLYSSIIQLTCTPDKIVVCVRKTIGGLTCADTDSYATIKNISINFNKQAGLVSSMTPEQLYNNSVQIGLAKMSWDEFSGSVVSCCGTRNGRQRPIQFASYKGLGANNQGVNTANTGVQYVPTTGTILVLNFAEVIQLTEELYAPGSLGSFNLQLQVTVENNQNYNWAGNEYELVIMVMNSGVLVNERGTSST
ncbi:MAG: major capsid protein V20 domain-containing protein, partial [Candidatus Fonsibacter sp.]